MIKFIKSLFEKKPLKPTIKLVSAIFDDYDVPEEMVINGIATDGQYYMEPVWLKHPVDEYGLETWEGHTYLYSIHWTNKSFSKEGEAFEI